MCSSKGKKGVVSAALLFAALIASGLIFTGSYVTGTAIFDSFEIQGQEELIDSLQNHHVVGIFEYDIANETEFIHRSLFPKDSEYGEAELALIMVWWDDLGNAVNGINFSSVQASNLTDRRILGFNNGNVTFEDPLNSTSCVTDLVDESYSCMFVMDAQHHDAPGGIFYEGEFSLTGVNHYRTIDVVYLAPNTETLTTVEALIQAYSTQLLNITVYFLSWIEDLISILIFATYLVVIGLIVLLLTLLYKYVRGSTKPKEEDV